MRIRVPWAGPWPAGFAWEGVDRAEGVTAVVVPSAPGPLEVRAAGLTVVLSVQPAGNAPVPAVDLDVRSLPALAGRCADRRFPRLAGAWAVGCGPSGRVDRAVDLRDGTVLELAEAERDLGAGAPGTLLAIRSDARPGLLWRLPAQVPEALGLLGTLRATAPPGVDGDRVALALEGAVGRLTLGEGPVLHRDADPLPWYPAAVAGSWVAWVDGRDRAVTGTDVWAWDGVRLPLPWAREPGNQRHVAGSGRWLGWIDDDGVQVEDVDSGARRSWLAEAGFRAGLSLWGPVACWEDRAGGSSDVVCSDGVALRGDGDQGWPSRWGPWLLVRVDGEARLATARALVLEDDDPRAVGMGPRVAGGHGGARRAGGVAWTLDWPVSGWCWAPWSSGREAWGRAVPLAPGSEARIENPDGDAVRLAPCVEDRA